MPTETDRKMIRLRVTNPDDPPAEGEDPAVGTYVDIPVIEEITFKDAKSYAQEYVHKINNNEQSTRIGHSHTVKNATKDSDGNVTFDDGNKLEVERCDFVSFTDAKSYAQEKRYALNNNDPAPQTPTPQDGDTQHFKTHIVRYTADNTKDGTPWVDVELIDEAEFKDAKSYAQESIYGLTNSDPGVKIEDDTDPYNVDVNDNPLTLGDVDQTLDLVIHDPSVTTINPPWRFDPFQNVVNVNWGADFYIVMSFIGRGNSTGDAGWAQGSIVPLDSIKTPILFEKTEIGENPFFVVPPAKILRRVVVFKVTPHVAVDPVAPFVNIIVSNAVRTADIANGFEFFGMMYASKNIVVDGSIMSPNFPGDNPPPLKFNDPTQVPPGTDISNALVWQLQFQAFGTTFNGDYLFTADKRIYQVNNDKIISQLWLSLPDSFSPDAIRPINDPPDVDAASAFYFAGGLKLPQTILGVNIAAPPSGSRTGGGPPWVGSLPGIPFPPWL